MTNKHILLTGTKGRRYVGHMGLYGAAPGLDATLSDFLSFAIRHEKAIRFYYTSGLRARRDQLLYSTVLVTLTIKNLFY